MLHLARRMPGGVLSVVARRLPRALHGIDGGKGRVSGGVDRLIGTAAMLLAVTSL